MHLHTHLDAPTVRLCASSTHTIYTQPHVRARPQEYGSVLVAADVDVIDACITAIDQEKDPRCLLTGFDLCAAAIQAAQCPAWPSGIEGGQSSTKAPEVGGGGDGRGRRADSMTSGLAPRTAAEAAAAYVQTSALPKSMPTTAKTASASCLQDASPKVLWICVNNCLVFPCCTLGRIVCLSWLSIHAP